MISKKHKKVSTILNYTEHFLILASAITGCVSISAFACLVGIPIEISRSVGSKICTVTAGITKYKPMIKKKEKRW